MGDVCDNVIRQFRSRRQVAISRDMLQLLYNDPRYSEHCHYRHVVRRFPNLNNEEYPIEYSVQNKKRSIVNDSQSTHVNKKICNNDMQVDRSWPICFKPLSMNQVFGQIGAITKAKEWLENKWKNKFLLLHGPTGCGKSTIANILLPNAVSVNFCNFSCALLQSSFANFPIWSIEPKKSHGLIISDMACFPINGQKYLLDLLQYFPGREFQLPVILILDDIPPSFANAVVPISVRISVCRPSTRVLNTLGSQLIKRVGLNVDKNYTLLSQCANISLNVRHFVSNLQTIFEKCNFQQNLQIDGIFSPFETLQSIWNIANKNCQQIDVKIIHWIVENTVKLIKRIDNVTRFCDDFSLLDCQSNLRSSTMMSSYSMYATRNAILENGYNNISVKDIEISYPLSLKSSMNFQKKFNEKESKKSCLQQAFNKVFF